MQSDFSQTGSYSRFIEFIQSHLMTLITSAKLSQTLNTES